MIKVTFKGVDITDSVSINRCYHDMYSEKQADTLHIRFNDSENLWDRWAPQVGDEIAVQYGSIGTGKMYVEHVSPENGLYGIWALSVPPTFKEIKNKAWQKVKLRQMGKEIADNHGLTFESFGVTDVLYDYILQDRINDFEFFSMRCALEGCAFLVYDGKLVMYDERNIEASTPSESIEIGVDGNYRYFDNSNLLYGSCVIEKGLYMGEYSAGNGISRIFIPTWNINVSTQEEANRFAQNMLRYANKDAYHGYIRREITPAYAAASMANLKNTRVPSWNGKVFINHIRNDYASGMSKIFFRRPLEGY